ncbi:MAG: DUF1127 domain-containing protein [Gammaproteobacteria bacterium]|nr:DUF1127 domain-containing protein [Gammaproteobacteria bacterium]
MNRATNQYSNTAFDQHLSLLGQSLTGYDWAPRRDLDHDTLEHYATVGHELRAHAFSQALRHLTEAIVGASGRAARALKHRRLRRANIRQLAGLTDHQLKDIGLLRAEIAAAVDKLLPDESQAAAEPKSKVVTIPETKTPANDEPSKLAA